MSEQRKEAIISLKEVKVTEREDKQKEHVLIKCPEEKPTSFRFKYNEGWAKEDTKHFHNVLRKNDIDLPLENYKDKEMLVEAFAKLKEKRNGKRLTKQMGVQEISVVDGKTAIEEEETVDQFVYNEVKAKHLKIIQRKPYKIRWSDKRFCQYETIPIRKVDELAHKGIDVNQLKNTDLDQYYDIVVRCPETGILKHDDKFYCRNHFRDKKYGRPKTEDLLD
jgi:hypothetical protein